MIWAVIILGTTSLLLGIYVWWLHHIAGQDVDLLRQKLDCVMDRVVDARASLYRSWMTTHEDDCARSQNVELDCDCGTDHFNAVLWDAIQHLTLKD